MPLAVANQQEAGVIGHLPPFVEIEARSNPRFPVRRAAAPAPARESRARHRRRRRETRAPPRGTARSSAARSSMAPMSTVPAEPTTRKGVRPASRSVAICARNAATSMRCGSIDRDAAQRIAAEAGEIHGLGDAAMRRRRGIGRQQRAFVADAVLPDGRVRAPPFAPPAPPSDSPSTCR